MRSSNESNRFARILDKYSILSVVCWLFFGFFDLVAILPMNSVIVDKINELDQQRVFLEEQHDSLKKGEQEEEKEQRKLSFYASVTKIIPNLEDQSKISGHIVEHDRKAVESFEFDPLQENAFDICNKTWKMINL